MPNRLSVERKKITVEESIKGEVVGRVTDIYFVCEERALPSEVFQESPF